MVNDRKEAFGVFWSIVALEHMLLGHPFTVQTDHRNLVYIEKSQVPKIICWHLRMQMFDLLLNTSLVTTFCGGLSLALLHNWCASIICDRDGP